MQDNDQEIEHAKPKRPNILKRGISEKQRTVLLVLLLVFAVGFIIWTKNSYSDNFVESF